MGAIPLDKFNLNRFWEKTPTPLKYILIFAVFIVVSYFLFSKRMDNNHSAEIAQMKRGIVATYELIDNFEEFRSEQDAYNEEILDYLYNLHSLVEDLNATTNRKLDMILSAGSTNTDDILEKLDLLNESFERISKAYAPNRIETPNLDDNKGKRDYQFEGYIQPVNDDGTPLVDEETGKTIYRWDKDGNPLFEPDFSISVRKKDTIKK
jgi:hypothetical protein